MTEGIVGVVITVSVAISVYVAGEVISSRRQRVERRRVVLETWLEAIAAWHYEAKKLKGVPANTDLDRISEDSIQLSFHSNDRWVAGWLSLHLDALKRGAEHHPQGTMDQLDYTVSYIGRWLIAWHKGTVRSSDFAPQTMLGTAGWGGAAGESEKYSQAVERGFQKYVEVFRMRLRDQLVLVLLCSGEYGDEMVRALSPRQFALWELTPPRRLQLLREGFFGRLLAPGLMSSKSHLVERYLKLWETVRQNLIRWLHSSKDVWPPGSYDG
ncbi:hypothetical protein [Cryobacterium sp. Hh38]|uniref:hypothetical protein n=1 Tax=Cryobacterium sp. Hh38 TaxID=1259156 RepID=UPI00106C17C8|nr:hypothetical protein [Cryobacterium sp. Hh38]TFD59585.1 hypothetical protein E3T41_11100 [Cryobacterium sp. Hh38]